MSRTVKKLLVFFTFVCIVAVVVFSAALLLLNSPDSSEADIETPPASSPGSAASSPPASSPADTQPPAESPSSDDELASESPAPSHEPSSSDSLITVPMPENLLLTLRVNEEKFDYYRTDYGDLFTYKGGGSATLEILLDFLPHGAEARAASLLDKYQGVGEPDIESGREIGATPLVCTYVTAMSGDSTYAAWIYEIPSEDDSLGILLVIHYRDEAQRGALYDLLDTIELIPVEPSGDELLLE